MENDEKNSKIIHPKIGNKTIEIDKGAPGIQGKRAEFGLAGDARPDRAPGESGRGDLSDTDRVASHGQGLNTPPDRLDSKIGEDVDDSGAAPADHGGTRGMKRNP